jgi:dipeptidyl aminopeptidase/acylaminoacyl peptidase
MIQRISKCRWSLVAFVLITLMDGEHAVIAQRPEGAAPSVQDEGCHSARGIDGKRRAIELADYSCVKEPSAVRVSDDGKQIAYVFDKQVYVIPADGGDKWKPTEEKRSWSPIWSRDAVSLYFLSKAETLTKLRKVSIEGNRELSLLLCMNRNIKTLKLSPDETRLLLELNSEQNTPDLLPPSKCMESETRDAEANATKPELEGYRPADKDPKQETREPKQEAEASKSRPIVVTGMVFKEDGTGHVAREDSKRIYAVDISKAVLVAITGKSEKATDASAISSDTAATWAPDGAQIAFIREYPSKLEYHSEVWITSSTGSDVSVNLTPWPRADRRSPAWSGDGKFIAYLWSDAQQGPLAVPQLAIYSLTDGRERVLTTKLDRPVVSFRFSADSNFIYFIYADEGAQHLARIRLSDGEIDQLIKAEQVIANADVSRTGRLAIIMKGIDGPLDVYSMNLGEAPKQLTDLNQPYFQAHAIAPKEKVLIDLEDGLRMEAFVTKPANFDASRRYPTVLNIHGGPTDAQHTYGYDWFPQFLAANGYVVIEPNPPGSFGRGRDNVRKIYRNWGCTDYPDILHSIDYAIAIGLADPEKLFVTGYSYGGYLTNCIITRSAKKFKAAASGAGHSLIVANYGHDTWLQWYQWELGVPWQNRELFEELSPLNRVGFVETPTMFLTGDADWNVPILNSELFYQSLRVKGVETQLVVYPDTSHSGWSEEFSKDYYQRILNWFDNHSK